MQARFKFWGEHHIDRTLQLYAAKTFKCFRNYFHIEMCFSAGSRASMSRMAGTIINNFQNVWLKRLL